MRPEITVRRYLRDLEERRSELMQIIINEKEIGTSMENIDVDIAELDKAIFILKWVLEIKNDESTRK